MTDNVFNPGDIPVGAADQLTNPLDEGGIRLPFAAPHLWWKNGDKRMKQVGGVEYFGGWAVMTEELDSLQIAAPEGFTPATWSGKNGEDYDVFAGRFIGFAPIAKRFRWSKPDPNNPNDKPRSKSQILGVAGTWDDEAKQFVAYGPVVLSASGMSGKHLSDALKEFERKTADGRKQFTAGLPANFFYAPLGTFGPEPNVVIVGKGEDKSPITPPTIKDVKEWNVATFQAFYIGPSIISAAVEWKQQAQEWLDAWKDEGKPKASGVAVPDNSNDIPF